MIHKKWTGLIQQFYVISTGRVSTWSSSDEWQWNVPCFLQKVVVISW